MFQKNSIKIFTCVLLFFIMYPVLIPGQTSPEDFLGFKIGADYKLADFHQTKAYFEKLARESAKLKIVEIGTSTLGKSIFMGVISSEENLADIDKYRDIVKKLRDPRSISPEEAKKLSREGKIFLLITCNIHAVEIASTQMSMELAYKLVTGDTPFDAKRVLDKVVFLLIPTINPDGHQMETEWYKKYAGTPYEGVPMPWLYHHYAGHDDGRDSFMLNLSELRAFVRMMYFDWIPQIHLEQHQMGSTGPRLLIPPFLDPPYPSMHPQVIRAMALCGSNIAYDLGRQGFKGIVQGKMFAAWLHGGMSDSAWLHNVPSLLSEMASVKRASPIYVESTEIPISYKVKLMDFPEPWPGGWWRLKDLVDYELALSLSLIKTCYLHKEDFLLNFYQMYKDCVEKEEGEPFAFVIPRKQHDYLTALRMVEALLLAGVEIHQAEKDFLAGGRAYSKGSFVIKLSQPYKPYVQAVLEEKTYPKMQLYPGGPPAPPYPTAPACMPLQMGVTCDPLEEPFETTLIRIKDVPYPTVAPAEGTSAYVVLDSRINASYAVAISLLKQNAKVYRSRESIKGEKIDLAPGSFIIANIAQVQQTLPVLLEKWHLSAYALNDIKNVPKDPLEFRRIGLYRSWRANIPEGWVRCFLDSFEIPFVPLRNKNLRGMKGKKIRLKDSFDVIVFASENPDVIKSGIPNPSSPDARRYLPLPPEYQGGIGQEGIEALESFVEEGGILVFLDRACQLALREFKVPSRNALEGMDSSRFSSSSSILRLIVDNTNPIGYGMPKIAAGVFEPQSIALDTSIPLGDWNRRVVVSFPDRDILLSGGLIGEEEIARKAAVVDTKYMKGRIVLIGIRSQNRAQSHGTYKFLLNAFLYPKSDALFLDKH